MHFLQVYSGQGMDVIVQNALSKIANVHPFVDPAGNASRVLFWYRLLFQTPPVLVMEVNERSEREAYADVTPATRELADTYGLKVIVDGCPDSLPPNLFTTYRERVMYIEPMSREAIESIPEFSTLIAFLREHNLADGVWQVFGGYPDCYKALDEVRIMTTNTTQQLSPHAITTAIKKTIRRYLMNTLYKNIYRCSNNTHKITTIFRTHNLTKIASFDLYQYHGYEVDYPNRVFREYTDKVNYNKYVVPATPAVGLIITNNIVDTEGIDKLCGRLFDQPVSKGV